MCDKSSSKAKGTAMNAQTQRILNQMIEHARNGHEIIPMFFQPRPYGVSNHVSAAIRQGLKLGLIEKSGLDGIGKPKSKLVEIKTTHAAGNA